MTMKTAAAVFLPAMLLVTGCAHHPPLHEDEDFMAHYPAVAVPAEPVDGAIFDTSRAVPLFEDIKARHVGDIVTVLLMEQTSGQQRADNNLSKGTAVGIDTPTFGGSERPNLAVDIDANRSFNGEANTSQSNRLNGSITVTVRDVLPGGNLLVAGEKWIKINQGKEYIRLSGIVRPRDINVDNTVLSTEVAEARISYANTGTGEDANSPGWASRILFSEIWPF